MFTDKTTEQKKQVKLIRQLVEEAKSKAAMAQMLNVKIDTLEKAMPMLRLNKSKK